ncbi:MAG: hypothetical protein Ta2B_14430 [Termitinemataceae bacterium]|nr:MAG: hypothetical protein Ta2B_14430 [Termitinemataceae bacterium]
MDSKFSTFVMSETTIEQIRAIKDEKLQLKFFWAVTDFGMKGLEPDFTGIELAVWIPMRDLIINSKRQDEAWRQKQRENGIKGGRPKKESVSTETQNNPNNPAVISETQKSDGLFQKPTENPNNPAFFHENPKTHNDNDNDNINDNINLNENENSQDQISEESSVFALHTSKDYPKLIFDIFTKAKLPNCSGNYLNFLQRDFRLGLSALKANSLHDRDVIEACKNYAKVLALRKDGKTWWTVEQPFNMFCEKNVLRFIPDNFNIKDFGAGFSSAKKDAKWTDNENPDTDLSKSMFDFKEEVNE